MMQTTSKTGVRDPEQIHNLQLKLSALAEGVADLAAFSMVLSRSKAPYVGNRADRMCAV
jgi:hypothetical protein